MPAFTFDAAGQTHTLPSKSAAMSKVPGRALRKAVKGDETAQMDYMFALVEAVATPEALDALYDMPQPAMLDVIQRWGAYEDDEDGATLGESSSSSA